jgi:hypothetical protein
MNAENGIAEKLRDVIEEPVSRGLYDVGLRENGLNMRCAVCKIHGAMAQDAGDQRKRRKRPHEKKIAMRGSGGRLVIHGAD